MKRVLAPALLLLVAGCSSGKAAKDYTHYSWSSAGYVEPAHSEEYRCFFVDVPTGGRTDGDTGIVKVSYGSTSGILHHMVVFHSTVRTEANGSSTDCTSHPFSVNWTVLFAAGVNTDPLVMPSGVALIAPAPTERLVIQLHLLNAGDTPVADDTHVDLEFTKPGTPYTPAGLLVGGSDQIDIPPDGTPHPVVGTCNVPYDMHAFAVWPHMHQTGTEFRIDTTHASSTSTLLDWNWNFNDQALYFPSNGTLSYSAGDTITTTCTYVNTGANPVTFGELTGNEMCFDFFYYYPAQGLPGLPCGFGQL